MMTRELVGGIAAILLGSGYLATALQIRASALADAVGPAGIPKALAVVMIALGVVLCVQSLLAGRRKRALEPIDRDAEQLDQEVEGIGFAGILRAGGLLAIGIAYLMIVRTVGYVPAIGALIVACALYGGAALTWRVFAIGIVGALFYWVLFVLILGIPLPAGILSSIF